MSSVFLDQAAAMGSSQCAVEVLCMRSFRIGWIYDIVYLELVLG